MRAFETTHLLCLCLYERSHESAWSWYEEGMIDNVHSFDCLCNDASDNALEEEGVFVIEDVEACWEEEVEV